MIKIKINIENNEIKFKVLIYTIKYIINILKINEINK